MWTLIDSPHAIAGIRIGEVITNDKDDPLELYEVKAKGSGYVKAVHAYGREKIRILPEQYLITASWWVKK